MNQLINIGLISISLVYPLAVYFGLSRWGAQGLTPLLLVLAAFHAVKAWRGKASSWLWVAVCLLLSSWAFLQNTTLALKLYPLLISLGMLCIFAWSLRFPPSAIERIARITEPDLPEHAIDYTRKVTKVWCGFFIVNGAISAWTAVYLDDAGWALYNGLISYLLMGMLFAIEYLVRIRVRSRYSD